MVDPYRILGVPPTATDAELRSAYRRLVQVHHPDHNGGSAESARRFEEVQEAYAEARRRRSLAGRAAPPPPPPSDPDLEARLAAMERDLQNARAAGDRARRAREAAARDARAAAAAAGSESGRPTDEELGYVTTEDSFSKIFDDAAAAFGRHLDDARNSPEAKRAARRVADVIDDLADKLTGERRPRH